MDLPEIITPENLSDIVEVFSIGIAFGMGGGLLAFIMSLIVNTFYGIADS